MVQKLIQGFELSSIIEWFLNQLVLRFEQQKLCLIPEALVEMQDKQVSTCSTLGIQSEGIQMSVTKLRKKGTDGKLYKRPQNIELFIQNTLNWSEDELLTNAKITDKKHSNFVPSEVMIHYLRKYGKKNEVIFAELFVAFYKRILKSFPNPEQTVQGSVYEDANLSEIRDAVLQKLIELILLDKLEYQEKLDYFEIRFNQALKYFKVDYLRKMKDQLQDQSDSKSDDLTELEESEVATTISELSPEDELTFRINIRPAINRLPKDERDVINLVLADIPIETNKDGEKSISSLLNCSEKTVRNRRDRALKKLRQQLKLGEKL